MLIHPSYMKGLATLLFLSLSLWSSAQKLAQGVVADHKTHQPISLAHIFWKDYRLSFNGTVSGLDGKFSIRLPATAPDSLTLTFSCLGYIRARYTIASLPNVDTVFLREEPVYLSPVTVTPLTAAELIQTCIDKIPGNYQNIVFVTTCFVWQTIEADGEYESFRESLATLYEHHDTNTSHYGIIKDSVLGKYPAHAVPVIPPLDSIYKLLYFDFARAGSGILNTGTLREWSMHYAYDAAAPESHWVIDAERKDHLQHARIYIDPDDYAFRKIEFGYTWKNPTHNRLNDTLYYSMQSVNGTLRYEKNFWRYGIKYITLEAQYTTGSTAFLKPHEPAVTHKATIEYVVIGSRERPDMRSVKKEVINYRSIRPEPVDRGQYQRVQNAIQAAQSQP